LRAAGSPPGAGRTLLGLRKAQFVRPVRELTTVSAEGQQRGGTFLLGQASPVDALGVVFVQQLSEKWTF